ncbi:pyrroloquinoline quinone biosynthesis protein D [Enterovirga rhinocerotis]|uniref:Pyrroloquinoline quinone biosynthesis protein D n=1 Tax=Enterovirga rhinocerotis TaxID=1339210 RepID=A0A4R7BJ10_9HYPH|nr:pyrroloquinoline quinone biosynthesis peptide chaperone PqqD [Enterovirga rhinocerotis]TDR85330.1 pyrroloquinoline quinone biosynthesis protein D [Enterovirga rhinocerotis]
MNRLPTDEDRPRLVRGVKLRPDAARGGHVLLAPERVVALNPSAVAVVERCDGSRSLAAIVDELAAAYAAARTLIESDVHALVRDLAAKRLIEW